MLHIFTADNCYIELEFLTVDCYDFYAYLQAVGVINSYEDGCFLKLEEN